MSLDYRFADTFTIFMKYLRNGAR